MNIEDIALTLTPGLGPKGAARLLEVFFSAEKIFAASRAELIHFAELNPKIADAIVGRVAFPQAKMEMEYCRRKGITAIASTDEQYPPLLRHTPDYPHVIYVMGNVAALKLRAVSIVGTRRLSSYGDRVCLNMVRNLGEKLSDLVVVSGLALGVDGAAHRAAIHYDIPTIAVLPNALPAITPTQHTALAAEIIERGGAIISEFHSQTKQCRNLYHSRNRIIAGLSGVTVVVESPAAGGSMNTALTADGYERLVMAVPGRLTDVNSAGCNRLIATKVAQLYMSEDQLIREMMWDCDAPADRAVVVPLNSDFTPIQQSILNSFTSDDPLSIEELCDRSGLGVSELSVQLMELELSGVMRMLPGNRYEILNVVVAK
ncbi:MAG: DNA-processing protein DprA [Rikenellaceae bacterium]